MRPLGDARLSRPGVLLAVLFEGGSIGSNDSPNSARVLLDATAVCSGTRL